MLCYANMRKGMGIGWQLEEEEDEDRREKLDEMEEKSRRKKEKSWIRSTRRRLWGRNEGANCFLREVHYLCPSWPPSPQPFIASTSFSKYQPPYHDTSILPSIYPSRHEIQPQIGCVCVTIQLSHNTKCTHATCTDSSPHLNSFQSLFAWIACK